MRLINIRLKSKVSTIDWVYIDSWLCIVNPRVGKYFFVSFIFNRIIDYFTNILDGNNFICFHQRNITDCLKVGQYTCNTKFYFLFSITILISKDSFICPDRISNFYLSCYTSTTEELVDTLRSICNSIGSTNQSSRIRESNCWVNSDCFSTNINWFQNFGVSWYNKLTFNQISVIISNKQSNFIKCLIISCEYFYIRYWSTGVQINGSKNGLTFKFKWITR